jgi:hypothetical protein
MIHCGLEGFRRRNLKLHTQPRPEKYFFSKPAPHPPLFAHVEYETRRLAAVWRIVGPMEEVCNLHPPAAAGNGDEISKSLSFSQ